MLFKSMSLQLLNINYYIKFYLPKEWTYHITWLEPTLQMHCNPGCFSLQTNSASGAGVTGGCGPHSVWAGN